MNAFHIQCQSQILAWWRDHSAILPNLSSLARRCFCLPASVTELPAATSIDSDRMSTVVYLHKNTD